MLTNENSKFRKKEEVMKKVNSDFASAVSKCFTDPKLKKQLAQYVKAAFKIDSEEAAEKKLEEIRSSYTFQAQLIKGFEKMIADHVEEDSTNKESNEIAARDVSKTP
jgi:hypothetical protein